MAVSDREANSRISFTRDSLLMSSFQPVSCAASRTFWPLRPMALAQHVEHEGLYPVAGAVALARRLLPNRQDRLGASQVDDDVAALEAQGDSRDDLPLAVLVVVEDVLALGIPGALDDHLLGGLGSDPAESLPVGLEPQDVAVALVLDPRLLLVLGPVEDLEQELIADFRLDPLLARLLQRDLVHRLDRILHLDALDDRQRLEYLHHLLVLVVGRLDGAVLAEVLLRGLGDGVLQRVDQDGTLDALVLRHLVEDHVQVDDGGLRCGGSHSLLSFLFCCRHYSNTGSTFALLTSAWGTRKILPSTSIAMMPFS